MKIFTYKDFPAINMEKVNSFDIDIHGNSRVINGEMIHNYCVQFWFSSHQVIWKAESEKHAHAIYNSILDHLDDSTNHVHII